MLPNTSTPMTAARETITSGDTAAYQIAAPQRVKATRIVMPTRTMVSAGAAELPLHELYIVPDALVLRISGKRHGEA